MGAVIIDFFLILCGILYACIGLWLNAVWYNDPYSGQQGKRKRMAQFLFWPVFLITYSILFVFDEIRYHRNKRKASGL